MKQPSFMENIGVTFLREGEQFVAYSPALDLSTAGDSLAQAQSRFAEAAQLFFEECFKTGTLSEVLTDLGWSSIKGRLTPPVVVAQDYQKIVVPLAA